MRTVNPHLLLVSLAFCLGAQAGVPMTRVQEIPLRAGWNAVFVQVEPLSRRPGDLFAGAPVDQVATFFEPLSTVQFISDPEDKPWNRPGWGIWYAAHRPDAFLTTLHAIGGNRAYLVHALEAHVLKITGEVRLRPMKWRRDSWNLVGFSVDPVAPPTFSEYFSGAEGSLGSRILRLVDGRWNLLSRPEATGPRDGEACWPGFRSLKARNRGSRSFAG